MEREVSERERTEAFWVPRRSKPRGCTYKRPTRSGCFLLVVFLVMIFALWHLEASLMPSLWAIAQLEASGIVTQVMAEKLRDSLAGSTSYRDLIYLEKDTSGRIVFMQANTEEVARIQSEGLLSIQQALNEIDGMRIRVPLGQVLGSGIIASIGPSIPMTVRAMGVASARVRDTFEARGINNVRHSLCIEAEADVRIVVPLLSSSMKVSVSMPLADAVIAGEVPRTYMNWSLDGE